MDTVVTIVPYWHDDQQAWVFDDPPCGLIHEPFVNGFPDLIDRLARDISDQIPRLDSG